MEKLVEIKGSKDKYNDSVMYRFQCGCLAQQDAMDIRIDRGVETSKFIMLNFNLLNQSFCDRLKECWNILFGNWCWREFVVREEDYQSLSDIFDTTKKFDDLN